MFSRITTVEVMIYREVTLSRDCKWVNGMKRLKETEEQKENQLKKQRDTMANRRLEQT